MRKLWCVIETADEKHTTEVLKLETSSMRLNESFSHKVSVVSETSLDNSPIGLQKAVFLHHLENVYTGIVTHMTSMGKRVEGYVYEFTITSAFEKINQKKQTRVHPENNIIALIKKLVAPLQLTLNININRIPDSLELFFQYTETDFVYLQKLCNHHGYLFFIDKDAVLHIVDEAAKLPVMGRATYNYDPKGALKTAGSIVPSMEQFQYDMFAKSEGFIFTDYDRNIPSDDKKIETHNQTKYKSIGKIKHFGLGTYSDNYRQTLANIHQTALDSTRMFLALCLPDPTLGIGSIIGIMNALPFIGLVEAGYRVIGMRFSYEKGIKGFEAWWEVKPADKDYYAYPLWRNKAIGFLTAKIIAFEGGNILDTEGRYRIILNCDELQTPFPLPVDAATLTSGPTGGFHFPFQEGVEVIVGFLSESFYYPIITGALPNNGLVTRQNPGSHILQSPQGQRLHMDDTANSMSLDSGEHQLVLGRESSLHSAGTLQLQLETLNIMAPTHTYQLQGNMVIGSSEIQTRAGSYFLSAQSIQKNIKNLSIRSNDMQIEIAGNAIEAMQSFELDSSGEILLHSKSDFFR